MSLSEGKTRRRSIPLRGFKSQTRYIYNLTLRSNYRRPTFKCVVKRLRFCVFQGDCEFNYCVLGPPGLIPTYVIVTCEFNNCESGKNIRIRIRIYCILAFILCGPMVSGTYSQATCIIQVIKTYITNSVSIVCRICKYDNNYQ